MSKSTVLEIAGREVTITNPDKLVFSSGGHTKLDLVRYYLDVADGALRGVVGRPMILKRFVKGIDQEAFFQKRAPGNRPDWVEVAELHYASGRSAAEVVVRDAASLAYVVNLGCIDLNPHPVQAEDLDHPDELRIDLDPVPGVAWEQIRRRRVRRQGGARRPRAHRLAEDLRVTWLPHLHPDRPPTGRSETYAWPPSPSRARSRTGRPNSPPASGGRRSGKGVFVDFNQNAKDRTVASAYSVRPTPDARVSMPLTWAEVHAAAGPSRSRLSSVSARYAETGDPWDGIEQHDRLAGAAARPRRSASARPRSRRRVRDGASRRCRSSRSPAPRPSRRRSRRWSGGRPGMRPSSTRCEPADILVDGMRGRSSVWYRIRVNLQHVPEAERPAQEPLEVDYDPWADTPFARDQT